MKTLMKMIINFYVDFNREKILGFWFEMYKIESDRWNWREKWESEIIIIWVWRLEKEWRWQGDGMKMRWVKCDGQW